MSGNQRISLGKGLAALLGENSLSQAQVSQQTLSVEVLIPGSTQPRKSFSQEHLDGLIDSVQRKGVLQPILVRKVNENKFEIIAGERRWRAAKAAKLEQVPVIMLNCSNREALEIGLIENLQRHDLNALEEAEAIQRLQEEFQLTQEQISSGIGKSRSHVANMLRLNNLNPEIKELLRQNKLSAGHARSLITAENPQELANEIILNNLSVRQTEKKAKKNPNFMQSAKAGKEYLKPMDTDIQALTAQLAESLNMKVEMKVNGSGQSGSVTVKFQTPEQLDILLLRLQNAYQQY